MTTTYAETLDYACGCTATKTNLVKHGNHIAATEIALDMCRTHRAMHGPGSPGNVGCECPFCRLDDDQRASGFKEWEAMKADAARPRTIIKAGRTFDVLSFGTGRVTKRCKCESCKGAESWERWSLLPCECHATMIACTCALKDRICNGCGRVFVPLRGGWYEIEDPHAKTGGAL